LFASALSRSVSSGKTRPASASGNRAAARLAALARPRSDPKPFSVASMGRSRSTPSRSAISGWAISGWAISGWAIGSAASGWATSGWATSGGSGSVTSASDLRRMRPE
jgi:hypothetical protein